DDSRGRDLMVRSNEAIEEADRDGFDPGLAQAPNGGAEGGDVEWDLCGPVVAQALRNFRPPDLGIGPDLERRTKKPGISEL
ncbi:MAG TPA: hypothetical protein VGI36_14620, partial [Candidatus Binataceae bacterium]